MNYRNISKEFVDIAFNMLDRYKEYGHSNYCDVACLEPPYCLELVHDELRLTKSDFNSKKESIIDKRSIHGYLQIGALLDSYINDLASNTTSHSKTQ